jgi:demethylmenaquinone methyltransferase / 2-methoxy-6-polyprenyl-1,4-benzoquinol methylase
MQQDKNDDEFVRDLFDRMGPSYSLINVVSSFGFSEVWRKICVSEAQIVSGSKVCDMMGGSGECWKYILRKNTNVVSVDFSNYMVHRQFQRKGKRGLRVEIRNENATCTSIREGSIDSVISAFGLKTLSSDALEAFAVEINRILRPGGTISLLEISVPAARWLRTPYKFYLKRLIPLIGKLFLGDIDCYRMLGIYTEEFGSCSNAVRLFKNKGLDVSLKSHFFGCATSLVGKKAMT